MAILTADRNNPSVVEPEKQDEYKVLDKLDRMWREAVDHPVNADWRPYAEKAFKYHKGEQLDALMLADLTDRGQPPIVENMIRPQRKSFMRVYHQLRLRAAFTGRNLQMDEQRAHVFNDLNRFVDQQAGFFDEEALAVKDMWIAGRGWIERKAKPLPDGYPMIGVRREDPFVMWPDPFGRRRDLADHRYLIRSKWVDLDEAMEQYPKKKNELRNCVGMDRNMGTLHTMFDPDWVDTNERQYTDAARGRLRLAEVWYRRRAQRKVAVSAEGKRIVLDHLSTTEATRVINQAGLTVDEAIIDEMMVGIYCGTTLIHHDRSPYWHGMYPFTSYVYERDIDGMPVGWVTEDLMSLQDAVNKRQSKALHLMNTKQVVYTENAVEDDDELASEVAKPDGLIKLSQVRNIADVFQMIPNTDMGQAQLQMYMGNRQAFSDVGSRNQVGEGQAPGDVRSDRGLQRLENNAIGLDAEVLNGIKASRRDGLLVQTSLIQQFFTDDMIFQVTEDPGAVRTVLVKRNDFGDLRRFIVDLVLIEENDYATSRQQQLDGLMQALPQFLSINPAWASILIGMTNLREKDQLIQQVQAMSQPQPPQPKISLALSWADMSLIDRAIWAPKLGLSAEEQGVMMQRGIPSKTEMLVQSDQAKQASKEKMEGERLDLKAGEVDNKNADKEKDREFSALTTATQETTKRMIAERQAQAKGTDRGE